MSEEEATVKVVPQAKRAALGRGLGALLGETRREEAVSRISVRAAGDTLAPRVSGMAMLPIAEIEPHPDQPRRLFDEDALEELARSIAARGMIQPVVVRSLAPGRYQLVAL